MGQVCELRLIWDETIEQLVQAPGRIHALLGCDDEDSDSEQFDDGYDVLSIDKSWHAIHYVLAQSDWAGEWPWAFLLCGGTQIGDEDVGYGPARAFFRDAVDEIADALDSVPNAVFADRFRLRELTEQKIYPEIWSNPESAAYVLGHYERLTQFLRAGVRKGKGLLISFG